MGRNEKTRQARTEHIDKCRRSAISPTIGCQRTISVSKSVYRLLTNIQLFGIIVVNLDKKARKYSDIRKSQKMPVFDVYDSNTPRRIETNSKRITIGRTAENHVPVDEGQASRCHCEIRLTDIGYILRDLKSRNGTHLNQDPIDRPMPLRDGDEIGVGKATIRFWSTLAKSKNSGVELPLISHAKSANQKTDSGTAIGRTDKRPRTAARPSAKAPKVAPAPHSDKGRKKADNHDTDTKIRLVEAPQPSPAGGDHAAGGPIESAHSGPLNIGHIIPLNAEGKPAHPVGDDGAELSAPMICLKKIFLQGLNFTATDIHMEPKEHQLHLHY